jgi:hypothetical protein
MFQDDGSKPTLFQVLASRKLDLTVGDWAGRQLAPRSGSPQRRVPLTFCRTLLIAIP